MIVSIVQTKGGVCKTTLAWTLASSRPFRKRYKRVGLVDLDPQGTLSALARQRAENGHNITSMCRQVLGENPATEVKAMANQNDALILDVPGESRSGFATRFAVLASDIVLIPTRSSTHDEQSLRENLWPYLKAQNPAKLGKILVLPVLVHPMSNPRTHMEYFREILPDAMKVIGPPLPYRPLYENFSRDGLTLGEYSEGVARNKRLSVQAGKAVLEIDAIAREILKHAT